MRFLGLLLLNVLLFISVLSSAELKVQSFDGVDWSKFSATETKVVGYEKSLKVQVAVDGERLYVRVRIQQKEPNLKHRPWVLKDEKFVVGKQLEDRLFLCFSQKDKKVQDLWFWGANRTQWGFADDGFLKAGKYSPDSGKSPWKLNLNLDTLHQNRNRYLSQEASASRTDVKVSAKYLNGEWSLVFSRLLNTGNDDDLNLMSKFSLSLSKDLNSPQSEALSISISELRK